MIVADTNVVTELMRPEPAGAVVAWVRSQPAREVHTTAVTVAEVLYGIERLPDGRRKDLLARTAREVFDAFADRVLPFDGAAAECYGAILAAREASGTPMSGFDAQIAAICASRSAEFATRNTSDFTGVGIDLVEPWADSH